MVTVKRRQSVAITFPLASNPPRIRETRAIGSTITRSVTSSTGQALIRPNGRHPASWPIGPVTNPARFTRVMSANRANSCISMNTWYKDKYNNAFSYNLAPATDAAFHIYGVDWEANTITYYCDGVQVRQITQSTTPPTANARPSAKTSATCSSSSIQRFGPTTAYPTPAPRSTSRSTTSGPGRTR